MGKLLSGFKLIISLILISYLVSSISLLTVAGNNIRFLYLEAGWFLFYFLFIILLWVKSIRIGIRLLFLTILYLNLILFGTEFISLIFFVFITGGFLIYRDIEIKKMKYKEKSEEIKMPIKEDYKKRIEKELSEPFEAKETGKKLKLMGIKRKSEEEQKSPEEYNKKDIINFFNFLDENYGNEIPKDPKPEVYLDDANFSLFYGFISNAKKSLDIITNVFEEKTLLKLLYPLKEKEITVRIITRRIKGQGFLEEFKKSSKLNIKFKRRNQVHAKVMIRDEEKMITGSSNIDSSSVSENRGFFEANIISEDKKSVNLAQKVFDSIWNDKDDIRDSDIKDSYFVYSKDSELCLPLCLKKYFNNEKKEVLILMGSGLIDKEIIDRIMEWTNAKVKIVTGKKWLVDRMTIAKRETLDFLQEKSKHKDGRIIVEPKEETIHAKVYIFKGQRIAVISSQNITIDSWQSLVESGYLISDRKTVGSILKKIDELENSEFQNLDNIIEIEPPKSSWQGTLAEKRKKIPWELAESNPKWRIEKRPSYGKYYKILKKEIKKKQDIEYKPKGIVIEGYKKTPDEQREKKYLLEDASHPMRRILSRAYKERDEAKARGYFKRAKEIERYIEKIKEFLSKKDKGSYLEYLEGKNENMKKREKEIDKLKSLGLVTDEQIKEFYKVKNKTIKEIKKVNKN